MLEAEHKNSNLKNILKSSSWFLGGDASIIATLFDDLLPNQNAFLSSEMVLDVIFEIEKIIWNGFECFQHGRQTVMGLITNLCC